ncbi:unnamed protein product [Rhodiola kirilowii]
MALFKRLFYRKPPDHLLEISERVYVFDCCFSSDVLEGDEYKAYMDSIVVQLQEHFPESSFMVFDFREGDESSQLYNIFTSFNMTVMNFPRQYEQCPLLPLEMIDQFLQSCDNWLSLESQQNVLLMHCERGGWSVLSFMLAGLLLYRKQFTGEQKTLEMMYKQASKELIQNLSPINPQPSQLRYLHYISRKTHSDSWPPPAIIMEIDTIILRILPVFEGGKGCRPVIRVYGEDPSVPGIGNSKLLFSTTTNKLHPHHYVQADCNLVKIDIRCSVKGDVVLECVHLDEDLLHEEMMFRAVFHTSFLQSNLLVLSRDEIDVLWDASDEFPKDFKAEVLFLDADSFVHVQTTETTMENSNENGFASPEEFFEVEEIFSNFVNGQNTKGEQSNTFKDRLEVEGLEKDVWKEEVDPHTFQDCTAEDVNQRPGVTVHPSSSHAVKDIGMDIMHGTQDRKIDEVKDIVVDQWDYKADPSSAIIDRARNKTSKEVVIEMYEDSEMTRDTLRVNLVETTEKLDFKVQEQKVSSDVGGRKTDKILLPMMKKPPTFFTKAVVDTADGKQKAKQQEPSFSLAKSPKPTVSKWIPSNKGSYTNSMHVAYPPTRTTSAPPSLAAVTVPKKINFLRKGDGAKKSASHTDFTCVRVSHGPLDSLTARFTRTPPSPLPLVPFGPPSPLVSPSCAYRFGVPPLPSRAIAPSTEDIQDSGRPCLTLPPLPTPKPTLSTTSLQLTQSSKHAPPPFHNGTATQEFVNSLQSGSPLASPPCPSPSLLAEEKDGRQVCSPTKSPPAPPWKSGYSDTSPIKTSNDSSIPPPPPPPLFTRTATVPESTIRGVCKAIPAPPWHGAPPDCSSTLAEYPSIHEMPAPSVPSSPLPLIENEEKVLLSSLKCGPPPPPPRPQPSPSMHRHEVPSSQSVQGIPSLLLSATGMIGASTPHPTTAVPPPLPPIKAVSPPLLPVTSELPPPPPPPTSMSQVPRLTPLLSGVPPPPPPPLPMSRETPPPPPMNKVPPPLPPTSGVPSPPPPPMSGAPPPPIAALPPPPAPMGGALPPPLPLMNGRPSPPPLPLRGAAPPLPLGSGPSGPPALRPPGGVAPPPPMGAKGPGPGGLSIGRGGGLSRATSIKKSSLKPLHWSKVTRALKGSLWEELQRNGETHIAHEFDVLEIERLFSAVVPKPDKGGDRRKSAGSKTDKVTLVDLRRANNTEIMLSKVKIPLPDIMSAVLALDESVLDIDQVENLIKFCPTKEEMDLLKAYTGDKVKLGKCEQYFLELMKVPRVESKLRVFAFKIQFGTQITDFKKSLNIVNSACEEVRKSLKLKEIMKKILFLGNTLNNGTARGSAVGFKLDSLLKLYDTRSSTSKMTLMHYLCKVLASKSPTLLDFHNDLGSIEAASKIQLRSLAEEMQAISEGLEKVKVELAASENDGPVSDIFRKTLKEFVGSAGTEVASVTELHSAVAGNADALALYFGEDPARYPFEQVCATIVNFVRLFQKAHEENLKETEQEKKRLEKETESEKAKGTNISMILKDWGESPQKSWDCDMLGG